MSQPTASRQIRTTRQSTAYWRVTFDFPPLNIFGPDVMPQLDAVVRALETDPDVKVVVFDSAVEGFFITHYDFLAKIEDSTNLPMGRTGLQALPDALARLSRAPVVSIASIRGRATVSAANLPSPATCALPAARRPSFRNGKWAPALSRAAARWRACRA